MKKIIAVLILTSFIIGCNHFDTADLETQFIYIKSAKYKKGNLSGFNKGSIPDVHITIDGEKLGLLRLPRDMAFNPAQESSGVIMLPAVPMDGIKSNSKVYPMLDIIESFVVKDPLSRDTMNLTFDYREEVQFNTLEGFEFSNNLNLNIDNNSNTTISRTEETSFEGAFSGKIHLTKDEPICHIGAANRITAQEIYKGLFLEMTYKNEIELFVGLSAKNNEGKFIHKYKVYLAPKTDWNTIYVDLTDIYLKAGSTDVRLALGAEMDTTKMTTADIYIDNVKLMYN